MQLATNKLVTTARKAAVPTAITSSLALAACLVFNVPGIHAAATNLWGGAAPLSDSSVSALTSLDQAMEAVTTRVTPAVVKVDVISKPSEDESAEQGGGQSQQIPPELRRFFGGGMGQGAPAQPQLEHGIGSGVIVSPDGYIVTNNHVIDGATQIRVTLNDRRILTGKVIGVDKLNDLAVIKVSANNLPTIAWGDSTRLIPGQTVLAFGSPFGSLQFSVTRGIVSAINRQDPYRTDARTPSAFIQTDAAINPGNSGGPLVNAHGELVGINARIISNTGSFQGAGFAIPSQIVRSSVDQLIAHGKIEHGYLGISMNDVTPENAHFFNLQQASGAIVAQVSPDSPAARAGLHQGDVIQQLNGSPVLDSGALQVAVSEIQPNAHLSLGILREGKPQTVDVTVGSYTKPAAEVASNDDSSNPEAPRTGKLGLAVSNLTQDTRQQLHLPGTIAGGVVIQQVRPSSPADQAGLQPGDVVLEVNRHAITGPDQFTAQIHSSPADRDLLLLVWSHGSSSYRTLTPDANNESGQ